MQTTRISSKNGRTKAEIKPISVDSIVTLSPNHKLYTHQNECAT